MTQQMPMQQQTPQETVQGSTSDLTVTRPPEVRRPGLVTFACVMMGALAAFFVVAAIVEWSNSAWLYDKSYSVAGSQLVFWGFVDFALALLSAYVAYALAAGQRSGQVLGFVFAGISMVRWLFYIPADPWLALSILVIDGLVIYGLAANDDYFARLAED